MTNAAPEARAAARTRACLEAGLDLTRALGAHLNAILHLAREAAEHRELALEAPTVELREAHLELATACQRRIDEARRAQYWAIAAGDATAAAPSKRAA